MSVTLEQQCQAKAQRSLARTLEPLHCHHEMPYDLEARLVTSCWLPFRLCRAVLQLFTLRGHQFLLAGACFEVYIVVLQPFQLALRTRAASQR